MTEHDAVRAARKPVAKRLATVLIDQADAFGMTPDGSLQRLDQLTETDWAGAVRLARKAFPDWHPAKGYSPSPATRALTTTIIRYRLQADAEQDPFAGLG